MSWMLVWKIFRRRYCLYADEIVLLAPSASAIKVMLFECDRLSV